MIRQDVNWPETSYRQTSPLRTLWYFVSPDKGTLALAMLFFLYTIKHSPVYVLPLLTAALIDVADTGKPLWQLWMYVAIAAGLIIQNVPTTTLFGMFQSRTTRAMEARLRGAIIRRLQQLSISFHSSMHSGRLHSKVLRDVPAHREPAQPVHQRDLRRHSRHRLRHHLPDRQPWVATFFLVTLPIAGLLALDIPQAAPAVPNKDFRRNVEMMSGVVGEVIEMIPIARADAVEDEEIARVDTAFHNVSARATTWTSPTPSSGPRRGCASGCSAWAAWPSRANLPASDASALRTSSSTRGFSRSC